ncbi:MAG: hypothetical protein M3209_01255 [Acidobacteriota bacterium]|nr:hypothetical protein [Acidobacteriota bacterium]
MRRICNPAPSFISVFDQTRQQGNPASNSQIAIVSDAETAAGSLTVQPTIVPAGITISNVANNNGAITADIATDCLAAIGNNTVVLTVTDADNSSTTANLIVNVTANTASALNYQNAAVVSNGSTTVNPSLASDNGTVTYSLQSQGTYTRTISVNDSSGAVSISNAAPTGQHTITVRATDNCNATTDASFTLTVFNPSIAGTVKYAIIPANQQQKLVHDVLLSATGTSSASDTTDSLGVYQIENLIVGGNYKVTPTKTTNINGITAFDATLVLRCVAAGGNCALTPNQQSAANTDGDSGVTAFDATQILRFVAANGPNANTGQVGNWKFDPVSKPYFALSDSLAGENYTAFLIGEIDGDWTP